MNDHLGAAAHETGVERNGNASTGPTAGAAERPFSSIAFAISSTGHALQRRFQKRIEALGIDAVELALLRAIAAREGAAQQAIGRQLEVVPSRMTGLVDSLEERGLLERRHDREDRRVRALFLTPTGRELLGKVSAAAFEHEQLVTSGLSEDEREQLLGMLARVGGHMGTPAAVGLDIGHSAPQDKCPPSRLSSEGIARRSTDPHGRSRYWWWRRSGRDRATAQRCCMSGPSDGRPVHRWRRFSSPNTLMRSGS